LSSLGFNYNFLQQYAKAETALRKAIELNPKDRFAYSNLGNACLGQKKYEEAIPFFLKQIEIVPDDKWAHANLGVPTC
jgi:tetratricopeptide (TPR) repeat protein